MKIALAQINPIVGAIEHNFKLILKQVETAKKSKANLIVFPELSMLGYPPKDLILKHGLIELQDHYIKELALYSDKDFGIIVGGISLNGGFGKKFHNSLFCLVEGQLAQTAHKTLLPSYDVFDEWRYFEPAKEVTVWEFQGLKLGLSICEDIWIEAYPNLYNRNPIEDLIAKKADLVINASASPYSYGKAKIRETLMKTLIARYKIPVVYVNQVGANDQLIFDGASMVLDSQGSLIVKAKQFSPDLIYVDSDLLNNKNTDIAYPEANISEIEAALVLGLKDYVEKCGFSTVVLGLSGGVDSALVAYLAKEALGAKNVYAYMLPSEFTSEESLADAKQLANNLGIHYEIIAIKDLHHDMRKLMPSLTALADENLQPRIRANILMAKANSLNAMLLATSNKSEIAVGYSTLYGDSCGAIAVIGDLLKTRVYELVNYINREQKIIPQNIVDKAPSAELRHDQKDSDSLPDYEVLDQIIKLYVEDLKSLKEIIDLGFDTTLVKNVLNMIDRAEYKRQQSPPILKVATKAFGVGRRMPMAQGFRHK